MTATPPSSFRTLLSHPSWTKLTPQARIDAIIAGSSEPDTHFYSRFLKRDLVSAKVLYSDSKTAKASFRFRVNSFYCNTLNNLHGGAQATIYDILTSVVSQSIGAAAWANGGVTRTLNVSYLRPAPEGNIVVCEVEVTQLGRTLSLLRGTMKREDDGALVSTCEHHKAAVPLPASKI